MAARPKAFEALRDVLGPKFLLLPADSLETALRILQSRPDVAIIICTVNFDESRMFDLLRVAKVEYSEIPFICVRAFDGDIAKISREALQIASEALGATAFVDWPGLASRYGNDGVRQEFLTLILKELPPQTGDA